MVVVSHGFWQQRLGGDPGLVGRQLLLNGQKFTVIGIASPDFDFPSGSKVWTPLDLKGACGGGPRESLFDGVWTPQGWRFHIAGPGEA